MNAVVSLVDKRSHLQRRKQVTEGDSEVEEIVASKEDVQESTPTDGEEDVADEERESEEGSEELDSEDDEAMEKPKFTRKLIDVEVIEGSAARMEVVVDGKSTVLIYVSSLLPLLHFKWSL